MPCPEKLTPRQCKVRDALAHKLEKKKASGEFTGNPWAVATAIVEARKEKQRGK